MAGFTTRLEALFPFENNRKILDNMFTHLTPVHKHDINMFCWQSKFKVYMPTLERFGTTPQTPEGKHNQSTTHSDILCLEF